MTRISFLSSCFFLLFTIASCHGDKEYKPYNAKALFNEEFKHLIRCNLNKEIGDSICIEHGAEQRTFAISYDKKTKENTITEKGRGIFWTGTSSKYKGLIFLNAHRDTLFQVSALRKTDNVIQGLCEIEKQQKNLDTRIKNGFDANLVLSKSGNSYTLSLDKKSLLKTYSSLLLELPEWQIKN